MDFLKGFNWVVVLGIVVAVETQIGNGTMSLANMVPETWIPYVKAWAANLGTVGALIMSAGAFGPRPQGQFTVTPAAKAMIMAGLGFAALFAFMPDAQAQTAVKPKALNLPLDPLHLNGTAVTGDASKDMQALWQKIVAASNTDLQYASALAGSSGTAAGKVRKQCWDAIVALNEQANGANLKNPDGSVMARPDPHLFTDVETLAEVIDNLSPQGPLFTSCAGAAELAKTSVFNFIAAAIGGAAGLAAMPVVPGL